MADNDRANAMRNQGFVQIDDKWTKLPDAMHRNNSKRRNEADKKEKEKEKEKVNKQNQEATKNVINMMSEMDSGEMTSAGSGAQDKVDAINNAKQVGNTNKDVANAKPGDWIIKKVVLRQADIDWAKKKLANKPAAKPPVPPVPPPAPEQTPPAPPVPPPVDKATDIAQVTGPGAAKAKTAIRSGKTSKPKNWAADQGSGWVDTHGERHNYDASYDPKGVWLKQHGGDPAFKPSAFDLNTFAMSPRLF